MNEWFLLIWEDISWETMAVSCRVCTGAFEIRKTKTFEICCSKHKNRRGLREDKQNSQSHMWPCGFLLSTMAFGNLSTSMAGRKVGSTETMHRSSTENLDFRVCQLFHCFIPRQVVMETSSYKVGILRKTSQCLELFLVKRNYKYLNYEHQCELWF